MWFFFFKNCDGSLFLGLEEVVGSLYILVTYPRKKRKEKKKKKKPSEMISLLLRKGLPAFWGFWGTYRGIYVVFDSKKGGERVLRRFEVCAV